MRNISLSGYLDLSQGFNLKQVVAFSVIFGAMIGVAMTFLTVVALVLGFTL